MCCSLHKIQEDDEFTFSSMASASGSLIWIFRSNDGNEGKCLYIHSGSNTQWLIPQRILQFPETVSNTIFSNLIGMTSQLHRLTFVEVCAWSMTWAVTAATASAADVYRWHRRFDTADNDEWQIVVDGRAPVLDMLHYKFITVFVPTSNVSMHTNLILFCAIIKKCYTVITFPRSILIDLRCF